MSLPTNLNLFLFGIYPYICLSVLFLGSLIRYDREPYSWKSDSSQMLRTGKKMNWGNNLFHYGVIVVVLGHFVGFLLPEPLVMALMSPTQHLLLAMVVGGIAGVISIIGLSIVIHRRITDQRIKNNSRRWDVSIVVMLWFQLLLGIATIPFSAQHMAGHEFEMLVAYVQSVVLFQAFDGASLLQSLSWVYKLHILLGFTIFLVSPFTRMVHIWSGVGSLIYLIRPYQLVRKDTRSTNPKS